MNYRKTGEQRIGRWLAVFLVWSSALAAANAAAPGVIQHVLVYREPGRFAGWPANHGAWSWGNELLVGFETGYFHKVSDHNHAIDYDRPAEHALARSFDGGETWRIEKPESLRPPPGEKVAGVPTGDDGKPLTESPGSYDFGSTDTILTARMTSIHDGQSRFYVSRDRGHRWEGPFRLPNFGQPGTAARTDYLVNGPRDVTLFLTVAKRNRKEGRVIAVRTRDGTRSWDFQSYVCPEPGGSEHAIMPSSVRLPGGRIVTAIRYRRKIDVYQSDDDAKTWRFLSSPAPKNVDNPPSLVRLHDGRLVVTYGYRRKPFGIRARLSADDGRTWSKEIILRDDGGAWDLGYTRTLQRPDGKLVTIYYYNTNKNAERFIGATIWDAGTGAPN